MTRKYKNQWLTENTRTKEHSNTSADPEIKIKQKRLRHYLKSLISRNTSWRNLRRDYAINQYENSIKVSQTSQQVTLQDRIYFKENCSLSLARIIPNVDEFLIKISLRKNPRSRNSSHVKSLHFPCTTVESIIFASLNYKRCAQVTRR